MGLTPRGPAAERPPGRFKDTLRTQKKPGSEESACIPKIGESPSARNNVCWRTPRRPFGTGRIRDPASGRAAHRRSEPGEAISAIARPKALAPAGERGKTASGPSGSRWVETSDYVAVLSGAAPRAPRSAAFLCLLFRTVGTREGLPSPFLFHPRRSERKYQCVERVCNTSRLLDAEASPLEGIFQRAEWRERIFRTETSGATASIASSVRLARMRPIRAAQVDW